MIVKTFRAPTIEEALAKVKAALGDSALVIDTRKIRPAGPLGFLRKPVVEVVVGIDDDGPPPAPSPRRPTPGRWQRELLDLRGIEKDIEEIKLALRTHAAAPAGDLPAPLAELHARLLEQGLEQAAAAALVEQCRTPAPGHGRHRRPADRMRQALEQRFRAGDERAPGGGDRGPTVVALLGPPGAGKTTMVAKLAGRCMLQRGERVALASVDFLRVGAAEQLGAYAEILGAPCQFVAEPDAVPAAVEAARSAHWLFVDTPGLPHHDAERLEQLGRYLGAFAAVERHLLLSAASDLPVALAAIDAYRCVGFDRLAFSRLDEQRRCGVLLAAAEAADVPVSYLSSGQDVADGLELASPTRLADLVLGHGRNEPTGQGA